MRIVFTGGGTGGHVFPIISVAREIRRRNAAAELRFVGPLPFGKELLAREGILPRPITTGKFPRYFTPALLLEVFKLPLGFLQAFRELYGFMPDVVFGKGGYGMVPVVIVAWLFRIPVIIHESDVVAGLGTRICAPFAREVLVSFPKTRRLRHRNVRLVGNPIRTTVTEGDPARAQKRFGLALKPTVLVLGGSQGADQLNELMVQIGPELTQEAEVIHQTGTARAEHFAREIAEALEAYPGTSRFYHVVSFLDEEALADAYAVATVVISRAGAGNIFELALLGKPTIFLPLPSAAGNHQYHNAAVLVELGAAKLLAGENLMPHLVLQQLRDLLANEAKRTALAKRFRAFAKPEAAAMIAETLLAFGTKEK